MFSGILLWFSLFLGSGLVGGNLQGIADVCHGKVNGYPHKGQPLTVCEEGFPAESLSVVEEYFLSLPAAYLVPPGASQTDFSDNARRAILAKSSFKPGKVVQELLDPVNGYLRFTTAAPGGRWVSEMTYFNNSLKERTVAVNHVWNGQYRFTHSIYFLEETATGWLDRTAGIVPDFNGNHPAFAFATVPALTLEQVMPSGMLPGDQGVAGRCLLFVLPRVGKELVVQRAHAYNMAAAADSGSVILYWKDGVFGPEHSILDDYAGLEGGFLEIDSEEPFRMIPVAKDNMNARMKCVTGNRSLNGKIRIGTHPAVNVHEGSMELTRWTVTVGGQVKEVLALIGTVGLDGSPFEVRFLELVEGKWVDAKSFPKPVIDLDRINAFYVQLPADGRMFDRIGLSELYIEAESGSPALVVSLKESSTTSGIRPVLMRLEFDGRRWQVSE